MSKDTSSTGDKPKDTRERWIVDPPADVKRMVIRAMRKVAGDNYKNIHGLKTHVLIGALRVGLIKQGHARKKDLAV